jgi:uncharacterized protein (DUF342 family)
MSSMSLQLQLAQQNIVSLCDALAERNDIIHRQNVLINETQAKATQLENSNLSLADSVFNLKNELDRLRRELECERNGKPNKVKPKKVSKPSTGNHTE